MDLATRSDSGLWDAYSNLATSCRDVDGSWQCRSRCRPLVEASAAWLPAAQC